MSKDRRKPVTEAEIDGLGIDELREITKGLIKSQNRAMPIARFPAVLNIDQLREIVEGTRENRSDVKLPESLRFYTQDQISPDGLPRELAAEVDIIIVAPSVEVTLGYQPGSRSRPGDPFFSISMYHEITPSGGLNSVTRKGDSYPNL
jgi:hypothetical protein